MTIAIGFISKTPKTRMSDEESIIIMSADSQSTYGAVKRKNSNKIREIKFKNGEAIVAQAGSVELGDKAMEIMEELAAKTEINDYQTVADVAAKSLKTVRDYLKDLDKDIVSDWEKYFWESHYLELLTGSYFGETPYLHKIDIKNCIHTRVQSFDAIGVGRDLGYMLLNEFAQLDPDLQFGDLIAANVVDKVIENTNGCGHPIWIGFVHPPAPYEGGKSWSGIYPEFMSEDMAIQMRNQEKNLLEDRREKMIKALENTWGVMTDKEEIEAFRQRFKMPDKTKKRRKVK